MRSCFEEFGLYHVDMDYVKYLYNVDSEVYFVNEQQYSRKPFVGILIDIDNEMDLKYRALLQDEVRACRNIKHKILEKAEKLYNKQLNSKRVLPMYCNFAILEENCAKYKNN